MDNGPKVEPQLAMANGTMNLRVDVFFFPHLLGKVLLPLLAFGFPVEFGHELDRAKMWIRVAVALNAPCHRQLFGLINRFHLVDAPMASLATDARIDVHGVVEVNELGQIMHPCPCHAPPGFPTLVNRGQLGAFGTHRRQGCHTLVVGRTVAVDTGRRRGNRRVCRVKDGVVTVAAVHLQLACVNRMAEGHRLLGLIAHVQRLRIGYQTTQRTCEYRTSGNRNRD